MPSRNPVYWRDLVVPDTTNIWNEGLGYFGHELRNRLHTATLALTAIKVGNVGNVGVAGATAFRGSPLSQLENSA